MEIRIEERRESRELVFFMKAETVEDSALLLRVAHCAKGGNSAFANFGATTVSGWVSIPLAKQERRSIMSGAKW